MKRAKSIAEYIINSAPEARPHLRQMRILIKSAAPGAKEGIKWSMPGFSYKRILVMFGAFKDHISLFPTGSVLKGLEKDLVKYRTGRGTIQFPYDKPLPKPLIRKVVAYRVKESREQDKKWRS